jgi:hypothetical protein
MATATALSEREQDSRLPLPGALLTRKWKGRTILLEVLAKGFRYENRHYAMCRQERTRRLESRAEQALSGYVL